MIFDILKDGMEYVKTNSNEIILYYLGILLFPYIFIESYSYHIIENCLNGMINNYEKLPGIMINAETFIKGLKLLVLKIIYYLPEILLIMFVGNMGRIDYYILTLVLVVLTVLSYYISQIASICMVESGSFREGFNFTRIYNVLKTVGFTYIKLIITTFVILLGICAVVAVITGIIMLLSQISPALFVMLMLLVMIAYIVLVIVIVPLYVLFKNRTIVSVYNLS